MQNNKKKLLTLLLIPLIIFGAIYTSLFFMCITKSDDYNPVPSDAILVLGYSLEDDQSPSEYLEKRLETALSLYNEGYAKNIIVSGGIGPTDTIPVAVAMKKWFIEQGVPSDLIYSDNLSNNTYENFVFTKQICQENDFDSIIVVTNDFHITRSMIMAQEFFNNVSGEEAVVDNSLHKFIVYLKEPLSLIKYEVINKNTEDKVLNTKNDELEKYQFDSKEKYDMVQKRDAITDYDVTIKYDDDANKFYCQETVTYYNNHKDDINTIKMNLYHNRLNDYTNENTQYLIINSITQNNKPLSYTNNQMYIDIDIPTLKPKDTITYTLNFEFIIPSISYGTGGNSTSIWASDFLPVIAQYKNGMFISSEYQVENAYNDMSNYTVNFITDSDYSVVLPTKTSFTNDGISKTTTMDTTMLRNLSFVVSKDIKKTSLISDNNIDISFYHNNDYAYLYNILHIVEVGMNYINDNIASYPYDSINIVEVSLDTFPVISNSCMIFVDKDYLQNPNVKNQLLYAIANQWFGQMILTKPVESSSIQKGLCGYISSMIYNTQISDEEHFSSEFKLLELNYDNIEQKSLNSNSLSYKSLDDYYIIKHLKSKLMIYSLSNILSSNWLNFIQSYFELYSFNTIDEQDFIILANEYSKTPLDDFFINWLEKDELTMLQN